MQLLILQTLLCIVEVDKIVPFCFFFRFFFFIFHSQADNVNSVAAILSPLIIEKKFCPCIVNLDDTGLFFTVEQARSVQACAKLERGMFQDFKIVGEEHESFSVDLSVLVDCLRIFGGNLLYVFLCCPFNVIL